MKKKANAAAEVTIMVRLRLVSKYLGISCAKKFICFFVFGVKSTTIFALFTLSTQKTLYRKRVRQSLGTPSHIIVKVGLGRLRVEETLDAALRSLLERFVVTLYEIHLAVCGQLSVHLL